MRYFLAALFISIYFTGCTYFDSKVREACTHGNCKSGWNSKYNYSEKIIYSAWQFGLPLIAFFIYSKRKKYANSQKEEKLNEVINPKVADPIASRQRNIFLSNQPVNTDAKEISRKIDIASLNDESLCPQCGSPTVIKIARKGRYRGRSFLGCSRYPACRGIRNLNDKNATEDSTGNA